MSTDLIGREHSRVTYDVTHPPLLSKMRHCFAMIRSPGDATGQGQRSVASVLIGRESYDVTSSSVNIIVS